MKHEIFEEMKGLLTETIFNSRWELLTGYHSLGELVAHSDMTIEEVAGALGQKPKVIHYCVELYRAYPDVNSLPMGKNVSWYKMCKVLPPYEKNKIKKTKQATHKSGPKKNLGGV